MTDEISDYKQYWGKQTDAHSVIEQTKKGVVKPDHFPFGMELDTVPYTGDKPYQNSSEPDEYPELNFREVTKAQRGDISTTYASHGLQKHPATFIPQIPSVVIRNFATVPDGENRRPRVLDCFSGRGTTGVEALISNCDYIGIEINPLSRLISRVSTSPVPPTLLDKFTSEFEEHVTQTTDKDTVSFPGRTQRDHWFEKTATTGLGTLRSAIQEFNSKKFVEDHIVSLTDEEAKVLVDSDISTEKLANRIEDIAVLLLGNTVFSVSNADPGISKAYKSQKMRDAIEDGDHPPDTIETYFEEMETVTEKLTDFWEILREEVGTDFPTATIIDGDSRDFSLNDDKPIDLVVTSPPYINAINYYRGSKLRLFWIHDLLRDMGDLDTLQQEIIGSNSSVSMRDIPEAPWKLSSIWTGSEEDYNKTRLGKLDTVIETIRTADQNNAEKKAYLTWKFFGEDMFQTLNQLYENVRPGGLVFFVIGENVISENLIESHKYVEDIAVNLGWFEGSSAPSGRGTGFKHIGSAFDRITNRDLFTGRNHSGGVIDCEWVVMLERMAEPQS